ncbi:MAG: hypothetical protein U9R79_04965, partial [Armatimonadota bacterium]|nr:hypothetical protein [Armatimonadota bacterium]
VLQDVLTGDQSEAEVEQNFQFEADVEIELQGTSTVATAPNGARLMLAPLDASLQPVVTVGDREPHTSYWPSGTPSDVLRREDGHDQKHGRGWTGRGGHKLMPAPAVTYVGTVELTAAMTVAIVPLAPGQDELEVPEITRAAEDEGTVWTLPTAGGALQLRTSVDDCSVGP